MKYLFFSVLFLATAGLCLGGPLRLQKRATFYVANETACVVDGLVYSINEPIPTDNPCETCSCRPPGFACVLVNCPAIKPGCREDEGFFNFRHTEGTQRDVGRPLERPRQCCPNVICDGCEYNGKKYRDGEKIPNTEQPCITCHCLGTSTVCSTEICPSRINCAAEYVAGECCPRYANCSSVDSGTKAATNLGTPTSVPTPPEVDQASSEVVNSEASKNPPLQDAPEINISSDALDEASETQERGSSETSEGTEATPQSIENVNSTEDILGENNKESELFNVNSKITSEESAEEPEKPADEDSSESTAADEENDLETTTAAQHQPSSELITTEAPTKLEKEIETNTIEKRFRSLENTTEEAKSETEKSDDDKTTNAEKPVTEAQEKQTITQESRTSTDVPVTDSSPESSKSEDTNGHSDPPSNTEKGLERYLYNSDKKVPEPESVETVTAVVNVHDETTGSNDGSDDKTSTSAPSKEENISTEPNIPKEPSNSEVVKEVSTKIPN